MAKDRTLSEYEKRLAIPTEDHPLGYADFEGVIPEDEYGGGTVLLWDRGSYCNLRAAKGDDGASMAESLEDGKIEVWLKFKCVGSHEMVIGGFTEPKGERLGFGALLIDYYHGDDLVYAGIVGTGFDDDRLESLSEQLESIERATFPFESGGLSGDSVRWVRPKLVAEIGFTGWTGGGKLRHPRLLGLRRDKDPRDVVREQEPS